MSVNTILRTTQDEILAIRGTEDKNVTDLLKDVTYLKSWLSKQRHLPSDIPDEHLEKILRMNKYSLEKSKKKIDLYFSIKNLVPEFFDNRDLLVPKMQAHMDHVILCPLPKLTTDYSRVHIFHLNDSNADNFDLIRHANYVFATADLRLFYDDSISDTYIVDMKNFSLGHTVKHNPVLLKKGATVVEKAYSDRMKGVHFINLPSYATVLVNLASSLFNEKMAKRVYVHKDINSLHEVIPKDILPQEYGGSEKPLQEINNDWRKLLENNNSWLLEISQKRSNESLRQGEKLSADLFGSIHGSFRQLNVD